MAISFQNQNIEFRLENKSRLKLWIKLVIDREKKIPGQINFVFTTDEDVLKANRRFLDHNTYTDIITFDSCEGAVLNGDILISVDRVRDNSAKFRTLFTEELHRVMIHGVLHLCGYKDKTQKDQKQMRFKEQEALGRLKKMQN